jgi:lipopolysaccharide biosynthesis protein
MTDSLARLIAFYLPQFHPIPENDEWWGKGFTEWTNVARAKPLFPGHYQPHLPAHLGFCDLRVPEVREKQAAMARNYGIEGFCYWHYWFNGRRLIERPFNEVLATGRPDFPVCLAWANETWSRRWLGEEKEILLQQTYSPDDDVAHIRWLLPAFADRRYVRVNGRPLFLIYRPGHLPNPARTVEIFQNECLRAKQPQPYLIGINSHNHDDWRTHGFDGSLDFEPQLGALPNPLADGLKIYDYNESWQKMREHYDRDFPTIPTVFVSWDRETIERVQDRPSEQRLVFINAWNEWAEGNHLEPDQKHGLAYLEAVRRVKLVSGRQ